MEYPTPKGWRQKEEVSPLSVSGITPIKSCIESPDTVPPTVSDDSGDSEPVEDQGRTYMSNELRGSRVSPLRLETKSEEHNSFWIEVSRLFRSSGRENVNVGGEEDDISVLKENYFFSGYKRERSGSLDTWMNGMDINQLSDWSKDSFDNKYLEMRTMDDEFKLELWAGADRSLLAQPGTPNTPSAKKRLFSPEMKTPRGRPRKLSTVQMESTTKRINLISLIPDKERNRTCLRATWLARKHLQLKMERAVVAEQA